MKTIHKLQDLSQYGIELLTGESDRYCIGRILCDSLDVDAHEGLCYACGEETEEME